MTTRKGAVCEHAAWEFSASGPEETGIVFHAMSSATEKMFVACTFSELADTLLSIPYRSSTKN